jgi:hypothetical protein
LTAAHQCDTNPNQLSLYGPQQTSSKGTELSLFRNTANILKAICDLHSSPNSLKGNKIKITMAGDLITGYYVII